MISHPYRLLAVGLLALPISAANAHTGVRSSTPRGGATVAAMPRIVTVTLVTPPIRLVSATVTRPGADATKSARLNPRNARQIQIFTKPAKPGLYTVRWSILGVDGHTVSGKISFRVRVKR